MFFVAPDPNSLKVIFQTNIAENWLLMWRIKSVPILWHLTELIFANECDLVPILLVLNRQALLNRIEFNQTTQDRSVAFNW